MTGTKHVKGNVDLKRKFRVMNLKAIPAIPLSMGLNMGLYGCVCYVMKYGLFLWYR